MRALRASGVQPRRHDDELARAARLSRSFAAIALVLVMALILQAVLEAAG
jgi:hypothetical protein